VSPPCKNLSSEDSMAGGHPWIREFNYQNCLPPSTV
jgi:hypothetical protein